MFSYPESYVRENSNQKTLEQDRASLRCTAYGTHSAHTTTRSNKTSPTHEETQVVPTVRQRKDLPPTARQLAVSMAPDAQLSTIDPRRFSVVLTESRAANVGARVKKSRRMGLESSRSRAARQANLWKTASWVKNFQALSPDLQTYRGNTSDHVTSLQFEVRAGSVALKRLFRELDRKNREIELLLGENIRLTNNNNGEIRGKEVEELRRVMVSSLLC